MQDIIYAKTLHEARVKTLKLNLKLIKIEEYSDKNYKIKEVDLIFLLKDLNSMLKAGLSLQESLEELCVNSYEKNIKHIFMDILQKLENGFSYTQAFGIIFNSQELAILSICEGKEDLDKAFGIIINLKEKNLKNIKQFKKAIFYPLVVLLSIVLAFFSIVLFVLPEFKNLFLDFKIELPLITQILFYISDFFENYYILVFFLLFVVFWILYFCYKKYTYFDKFLFYMPIFGKIIQYHDKFCFFLILSYLINTGIDLKKAFALAISGVRNRFLKEKLTLVQELFESGVSFSDAFLRINIFELFVIRMLNLSLKSSSLDKNAYEISLFFENKKDEYMQKILTTIEPLMTMIMAFLVLILALGIFLPIWELSSHASF